MSKPKDKTNRTLSRSGRVLRDLDEPPTEMSRRFLRVRMARRWSQEDLGRRIGLNKRRVSQIELGCGIPARAALMLFEAIERQTTEDP